VAKLIDRSVMGFIDALRNRLQILLESFWQEAEQFPGGDNEEVHTPHVHAQYLPVTDSGAEVRDMTKDFPNVLIFCNGGIINSFSDAINGSELHVQVLFFGYRDDPDNQGWRIPAAMLWRVLQDLLANTYLNGYQVVTPIRWDLPISEEPPYYAATMDTVWKGAPPAVEVPIGSNESFGNGSEEKFPVNS